MSTEEFRERSGRGAVLFLSVLVDVAWKTSLAAHFSGRMKSREVRASRASRSYAFTLHRHAIHPANSL
jgi:hypothetical protein